MNRLSDILNLNLWENIKPKLKEILLENKWQVLSKNVKVIKNRIEETKDTTKSNLETFLDPRTEIDINEKTSRNLKKNLYLS